MLFMLLFLCIIRKYSPNSGSFFLLNLLSFTKHKVWELSRWCGEGLSHSFYAQIMLNTFLRYTLRIKKGTHFYSQVPIFFLSHSIELWNMILMRNHKTYNIRKENRRTSQIKKRKNEKNCHYFHKHHPLDIASDDKNKKSPLSSSSLRLTTIL